MSAKERPIGYITHISEGPRCEPQPVDSLRDSFNQHVIGPLSHVIVNRTLDATRNNFLQSLQGKGGEQMRKKTLSDAFYSSSRHAVVALKKLNRELRNVGNNEISEQESRIIDILSPRQKIAALRLGSPLMRLLVSDEGIFSEITTVGNAVELIAKRHPELKLGETEHLINFLRNPQMYRVFRGIARGGNGFFDGFRRNSHPATKPWWDHRGKPILDIDERGYHITEDVLDAAQKSREINEKLLDHPLSPSEQRVAQSYGLVDGNAKQFSSGCPVKHLLFKTDVPELVVNDLSLSSDQVGMLATQTTPSVIQRIDPTNYLIRRDSYAEVSEILARALEIVYREEPVIHLVQ